MATTSASPPFQVVLPAMAAMTVPPTRASRIARRESIGVLLKSSTSSRVTPASTIEEVTPTASTSAGSLAQPAATGSSDRPMTVITEPVTTAGKKRTIREKTGATSSPITAETMIAPKTTRRPRSPPPSLRMIVIIVETEAKLMPCTSGSWEPKNGSPRVCRTVARPLTKSAPDTSRAVSEAESCATPPMMNGTAITPPNMDRMCCRP